MKDQLVPCSKLWIEEVTRNSRRFAVVNLVLLQLLEELERKELLPPERIQHYLTLSRHIDNVPRGMYDPRQDEKTNNVQTTKEKKT